MKFSVIIPTYNRGYIVWEAIESVLAQTYKDFELIVVDDGSTDDTEERVKPYLKDRRVRYVRKANGGVSSARNMGASLATGTFLSFLDSDDLWKPYKLEREVEFFRRHPDIKCLFGDAEVYRGERYSPSRIIKHSMAFKKRFLDIDSSHRSFVINQRDMFLSLLQEFFVLPSTFTVHRMAFERERGFNESLIAAEDWDLSLRLARREDFGYIDSPLTIRRIQKDSLNLGEKERSLHNVIFIKTRWLKDLKDDPEALKAAYKGLKWDYTLLNWFYLERWERFKAFKTCIDGFYHTKDPEMLLRAVGAFSPRGLRKIAGSIFKGITPLKVAKGV